jgi:hypothetical protein
MHTHAKVEEREMECLELQLMEIEGTESAFGYENLHMHPSERENLDAARDLLGQGGQITLYPPSLSAPRATPHTQAGQEQQDGGLSELSGMCGVPDTLIKGQQVKVRSFCTQTLARVQLLTHSCTLPRVTLPRAHSLASHSHVHAHTHTYAALLPASSVVSLACGCQARCRVQRTRVGTPDFASLLCNPVFLSKHAHLLCPFSYSVLACRKPFLSVCVFVPAVFIKNFPTRHTVCT